MSQNPPNANGTPGIDVIARDSEHFIVVSGTPHADHVRRIIETQEEGYCKLSVFVSCYNEQDHIIDTLNALTGALAHCGYSYEIIVVDDCSKDRSVDLITAYMREHPDFPILLKINLYNRGLGQNFKDAVFITRGKYFRLVCGDNVEPIETMIKIFGCVGKADLVLPYHAEISGKSFFRLKISRLYTQLINLLSGNSIRYYNGLCLFKRTDLEKHQSATSGFGFQADVVTRILAEGATVYELPVRVGQTKESTALTVRNMLSVSHVMCQIVIRRLSKAYHRRSR